MFIHDLKKVGFVFRLHPPYDISLWHQINALFLNLSLIGREDPGGDLTGRDACGIGNDKGMTVPKSL